MKPKDIKLRDYFAAHALTGLLANPNIIREKDVVNIVHEDSYYFSILGLAVSMGKGMMDMRSIIEEEDEDEYEDEYEDQELPSILKRQV